MSKLRIFIEGEELDSLESVTVPITKQFEELSDPTVICNDYSKTVTVPLSKHNNEIFGHCYNPDRLTAYSGDDSTPLVGIYFDPYKKLDCRLQWGDAVFFTGYAKMLKVTNKGYEVTINGELGKIFQELQKITFDKSKYEDQEDIAKYWIDGSKYVDAQINADLIYKCWNSKHNDHTLREVGDEKYDITDVIGFIPNNSFSNDFDYSTVELSDGTSQSIEDVLGEEFEKNTGYSRESVIGDGLYPVQMSQFRSYEQIPFIYWDMFWQIFAKKGEELTGYKWVLGNGWQNVLPFNALGVALSQRDSQSFNTEAISDGDFSISIPSQKSNISYDSVSIDIKQGSSQYDSLEGYKVKYKMKVNITLTSSAMWNNLGFTNVQDSSDARIYRYGALIVNYDITDDSGMQRIMRIGFCSDEGDAQTNLLKAYPNVDIVYGVSKTTTPVSAGVYSLNLVSDYLYGVCDSKAAGQKVVMTLEPVSYNNSGEKITDRKRHNVLCSVSSTGSAYNQYPVQPTIIGGNQEFSRVFFNTLFRSGEVFTLNDICTLDFTNILDYCKRYRLRIYVDEIDKTLHFTRSYFDNISVIDMSSKVDISSFEISTTTFDSKYVLFGYAETESQLGSTYSNAYGHSYGAKRLDTGYNFDTNVETLFEKTAETILYSPSYIYWGNMIEASIGTKNDISFWIYNNRLLECRDNDGKTIDVAGALFYPTQTKIDREWVVTVTDDSVNQQLLDTYYNYKQTTGIVTDYWTTPELVVGTTDTIPVEYFTCLFEKPLKNYTAKSDYFSRIKSTVYSRFWANYIAERYNTQNKKVTTYMRLTPTDFINFKFNQLWQIGNQIYMVNKISDYDITSDGTTKVELITVQNINNYK